MGFRFRINKKQAFETEENGYEEFWFVMRG